MKMNNESTSQQTTFLAIGDVHGNWTRVIEAIQSATDILGHSPDMVLQVGDAEALRSEAEMAMVAGPPKYKWLGEFQLLQPGDLACPVYFIAGNHEPYEALDAAERDTTILFRFHGAPMFTTWAVPVPCRSVVSTLPGCRGLRFQGTSSRDAMARPATTTSSQT